jgi:hypothetical protein
LWEKGESWRDFTGEVVKGEVELFKVREIGESGWKFAGEEV